jgi:hypothetical protein
MKNKKNKNPKHYSKTSPEPKTGIPHPPVVDGTATEGAKDNVVIAQQSTNKTDGKDGGKMEKIRWTDKLITFATVVIAAATIVQGYELVTGSRDTHDLAAAALAANRAWIAPEQIILTSPVESGLPLKYQIRITNPGKEPALEAISKVTPIGVPYIHEDGAEDSVKFGPNSTCSGLEPKADHGVAVYPQEKTNYWVPFNVPDTSTNRRLIEDVLSKKESLVIDGCFAYRTGGQKHTSSFRFFLRDIPSSPSFTIDKEGNPIAAWSFNAALSGNEAN